MKNILRSFAFYIPLLFSLGAIAQDEEDYVDVPEALIAEDAPTVTVGGGFIWNELDLAMRITNSILNNAKQKREEQRLRDEASSKLAILKKNYEAHDTYPDSITKGWHSLVITDNLKFCREAKAFVSKNRIKKLVIDNCIELNISAAGQIKKGRNLVTINGFNGEQTEVVDAYFIYDLDEPVLVDKPRQAGYVCFWTKDNDYSRYNISIDNGPYLAPFTKDFKKEPKYGENGTITLVLKPGTYNFDIRKPGNDYGRSMEIKAGKCLMYKIK